MPAGSVEGVCRRPKLTPEEVLGKVKEMGLRFIDLQLVDLPGRLHSATIAARELSLDSFKVGVPKLDGSSIRGFVEVHESDMVLVPDPSTFAPIPWASQEHRAARLICNVHWGFTGDRFSRDPRFVAQRAEQVLRDELGGDASSLWGPEPEFFILDRVEWDVLSPHRGQSYRIESREAAWSPGGQDLPLRFKEGYYPATPHDTLMELRSECVRLLEDYFNTHAPSTTMRSPPPARARSSSSPTRSRALPTPRSPSSSWLRTWLGCTAWWQPSCPSPSMGTTPQACTST